MGPIRTDPEPDYRVSVVLPAESIAALDRLARYHRRTVRSEAVAILLEGIARADDRRRSSSESSIDLPGVPRSVQARRRAEPTLEAKAALRRGER